MYFPFGLWIKTIETNKTIKTIKTNKTIKTIKMVADNL